MLNSQESKLPPKQFDPGREGPLSDVRVLDLSRLVAGNMLTLFLADFGADVLKIEREGKGDDLRSWREAGEPIYWKVYGRNKRSVVLDLKSEDGLSALKRLVVHSHVFVENFVPGGLEKMGLAPELLLEINPRLVIVRVSGWGQTGPYSHKPGFGTLVEAMSGFAHLNGYADKPPALPPLAMADMIAGIYGAAGVMTALRVAERDGKGQVVDLSLVRADFFFYFVRGAEVPVDGRADHAFGQSVVAHRAAQCLYVRRRQVCGDVGLDAVHGHAYFRHHRPARAENAREIPRQRCAGAQ